MSSAHHRGRPSRMLARVAALVLLLTLVGAGLARAADELLLKVDPATQTVGGGREFVVDIVQSATIATTGAQVDVHFNPRMVQLQDFELGDEYSSRNAILAFGSADIGTSGDKGAAIAAANDFGILQNAAGFLLPGSGTIPPGEQVFLELTFVALPGDGGDFEVTLLRSDMIDEAGVSHAKEIKLQKGAVTVTPGGSPLPSGAAPTPTPVPTEAPAAPVSPTTPVAVALAPTSVTLKQGNAARIFLVANADGNISSIVADLAFDPTRLEITGIEPGPAWSQATLIALTSDPSAGIDVAIQEANASGLLEAVGGFFPPGTLELPYGEGVFVSILVKAKVDGPSTLSLGNVAALGVQGETIAVVIDPGSLTAAPTPGLTLDATLVVPLLVIVALIAAIAFAIRTGRVPLRVQRRWPYYAAVVLGLVPVVLFAAIALLIVVNALPVTTIDVTPGLNGKPNPNHAVAFAALQTVPPALWGSVLVTVVALVLALPVSLALAIVSVDFPLGWISRIVRPVVGVMAGIPPIVYAVAVPGFVTLLMIPKFGANANFSTFDPAAVGADPATWPPADVPYSAGGFPWDLSGANSTLLAGILVGLFLVPFATPLIVDALRDVPRSAREASLALGANRTYTLRRVILPRAMPGIIGAAMLASLKALGDTLIVAFAAGWTAERFPDPIVDVLERTTTLAADGAGLIGSFDTLGSSCGVLSCSVGYTSAALLLLVAGAMVLLISYVQARSRRRVLA